MAIKRVLVTKEAPADGVVENGEAVLDAVKALSSEEHHISAVY